MKVFLSGATGFIGGRLAKPLSQAHEVVRGSRKPRPGFVHFDLDDEASIEEAFSGCDAAYFLAHSLTGAREDFAEHELKSAQRFARAAASQKLKRVVYLGGLEPTAAPPSEHLRSRLAVGKALREGGVPCLELRASVIIGHGSASFRILRDLAARLPAMVLPAWLDSRTEPIAVDDVIAALVKALEVPLPESDWQDLPGPETLSGREMLLRTARILGVKPRTWPVPLLTPRLSARWLWLISGVDYRLAQELVDGLQGDLLAQRRGFQAQLTPFDEAVKRALAEEHVESLKGLAGLGWETLVRRLAPT
ncbi:MAG TPA: NAD-dependent epimerase/dehydratase family protein [Myxococcales bacterium]|jgi:uncharacterized protein YbjT (DUF2867 family)|nr:NAD-dependent epimerase/dehydratase family protein [Myxococcales bacterium]